MDVGDIVGGKYELIRVIGKGGMGRVFEARHSMIKRRVALKSLHSHLADDGDNVARFIREAQAAAAIGSEYIVDVTDGGETDSGVPYLVMEYLEGEDLGDLLERERRMEPDRAVALIVQACAGFARAHEQGIVHRDLKPANLFLTHREDGGEMIKILDFGIAKFRDLGMTPTQAVFGTLHYMAPEQTEGSKYVDQRADIYSLGVILYELLTGRPPFQGDTVQNLLAQIMKFEFPPPRELRPELSARLEEVLLRAMARGRIDRYQTAQEFSDALQGLDEAPPRAMPETVMAADLSRPDVEADTVPADSGDLIPTAPSGPSGPRSRRLPLLAVALVLGGAVAAAAAWQLDWLGGGATAPTDSPDGAAAVAAASDAGPDITTADAPTCPPGRELSHGRCCAVGDEWVEARGRCLCLDDALCGSGSPAPIEVRAPGQWVRIRAGSFVMGSPADEPGRLEDEAQHRVTLTRDFLLQTTEVTQGQYQEVMGRNPARFTRCGADCPVERVSWHEAAAYCNALSEREELAPCYACTGASSAEVSCDPSGDHATPYHCPGYRLPTEAEWEYAARAGTTTALYTGPIEMRGESDAPALDPIAWYGGNSGVTYTEAYDCSRWPQQQRRATRCGPHPVGRKAPNAWGLFDMLGNVWEWCHTGYGPYYRGAITDQWGPAESTERVGRGGSWTRGAWYVRAAYRHRGPPDFREGNLGLRPIRPL